MTTTQHTPEAVLEATCSHFCVQPERIRTMDRPSFKDHTDQAARASKIAQALMVELCGISNVSIGSYLNRSEATIRNNHGSVSRSITCDKELAKDVAAIVKLLR